jgi:hypothetical protein
MEWKEFNSAGPYLRQKVHPDYCIGFRALGDNLVFFLLRFALPDLIFTYWIVLLLKEAYRNQDFCGYLRGVGSLFCIGHGQTSFGACSCRINNEW